MEIKELKTISDCTDFTRKVMADTSMRSGDKSRLLEQVRLLAGLMVESQKEEERLGNEKKTAVKAVRIEFINPSKEQFERMDEIDKRIEMELGRDKLSSSS